MKVRIGLLLLAIGVFLIPWGNIVKARPTVVALSDVVFLTAAQDFYGTALNAILQQIASPLATHTEVIGDQTLHGGDSLWSASQAMEYGINPKVLLVTLALQKALEVAPQDGFTLRAQLLADELWQGFQAFQKGERSLTLADGSNLTVGGDINAATFALAATLAKTSATEAGLDAALANWTQTYQRLFNADATDQHVSAQAIPNIQPFLRLPFVQPSTNFVWVNSFFDHDLPTYNGDSRVIRFDGADLNYSGYCTLGVNCYGGHNAIDYNVAEGAPIYAAAPGKVIYRYFNTDPTKGKVDSGLIIDHGNGYQTLYWHMNPIVVQLGDQVAANGVVGACGNIGKSSGPHLHFGLRLNSGSKDVDPYGWWSTTADPWGDSTWMWQGDLIADNREAQAQLFYYKYWTRETTGYLGEAWYTLAMNSASSSTNWGVWGAYLPSAGRYNVYTYFPKNIMNTTTAKYQVFHAAGKSIVSVDQRSQGNSWVLIGSYDFNQGPVAVILTDLTDNTADHNKWVQFDAVKWELAQPTATASPTANHTVTPTATATATLALIPTRTLTPTATLIPNATMTFTSIPSSTHTLTPTHTVTHTRTVTLTPLQAATRTSTSTPTPSQTPTQTPKATVSNTPTHTATLKGTSTSTGTITSTPLPSATAIPTFTPTLTSTLTLTSIPTPTATFTRWPSSMPTATHTATATRIPPATITPGPFPTSLPFIPRLYFPLIIW